MRVAIVHDYLPYYAGAERVLEQMLLVFPEADLFSLVDFIPESERGFLLNKPVATSFLQRIPCCRHIYRHLLPLMPLAIEQFDLSGYDLVLSSSYAVAKGVIVGPDQLHISYVHSPMRYAWDLQHQYLRESRLEHGPLSWLARLMLHRLRVWDVRTANGVDRFLANSRFVARRIRRVYRRRALVVHPPVDTDRFTLCCDKQPYYLSASRLVPYKRVDLIVKAFTAMPSMKLLVAGDGPELSKLKTLAGTNVELLGHQPVEKLKQLMQEARAFVFAAEEDFGIAPVEAMACGTPVIAFGKGGVTDSVTEGETGLFFSDQTVPSIIAALQQFERVRGSFDPYRIRAQAEQFHPHCFRRDFANVVAREAERFVAWRSRTKRQHRRHHLPTTLGRG